MKLSTRTYALQGKAPGWMYIAPINPLTPKQWKVIRHMINIGLDSKSDMSVSNLALLSNVSEDTARAALEKCRQMGLLRRSPASGSRSAIYRLNIG